MEHLIHLLSNDFIFIKEQDSLILRTSIMYKFADHTFSFLIKKHGNCSYLISDCGQTIDYISENFDYKKYLDKINKICERYEIEFSDNAFSCILSSTQTMRNLYNYLSAINFITNIDCLN